MRRLLPLALLLVACDDLKLPSSQPQAPADVEVEPVGSFERAPAVLRLRVKGAAGHVPLEDFRVFEGELTSYYLSRLAAHDEPDTLVAREVVALVWVEGKDVVVAPTRVLALGEYTLAAAELGALAEVSVDPELVPWLGRKWPPTSAISGSGFSVFCGDAAASVSTGTVRLAPFGARAELRSGLGDDALFADECVSLLPAPSGSKAPELPPALAGGAAFEPLPLFVADASPAQVSCADGELPLGPACALVDDDRVTLVAPVAPSLWALETPVQLLGVAAPGASLVVHGFEPGTPVRLRATAFDLSGTALPIDVSISGAPPREHVVLNEVLANPRGPESQSEWIEIANDGVSAVELEGFELSDSGGAVSLPAARLEPGELALLVAQSFAPDPELDVPPAPGTQLIVLPKLGTSGLSNAGELLRLSDASGRELSRFPAFAATDAGVSFGRRTPDAPDDEDASFGEHAPPGASPGAPNTLVTSE